MPEKRISFHDSNSNFCPSKILKDEEWIDTSFAGNPRAVGNLRWPAVNNGRYESKHPILDTDDTTVGFMPHGVSSIGYTFECVYAGHCFWIAHQGFSATMNGGGSAISLVNATGSFFFSKGTKFETVKSFGFGGSWVSSIQAFKLLDDGNYLLYLTKYGVCLFNTRMHDIIAKAEFADLAYQWSGFALSPRVKLLALCFSARGDKDLIDGDYRYRNFVRIYDLESGSVFGEQSLPTKKETVWTVNFSDDGRQLRIKSQASTHQFELRANQ